MANYDKRIEALQTKLNTEKAKRDKAKQEAEKKELTALGELVAAVIKAEPDKLETLQAKAKQYLKGKKLDLTLAALARLSGRPGESASEKESEESEQ